MVIRQTDNYQTGPEEEGGKGLKGKEGNACAQSGKLSVTLGSRGRRETKIDGNRQEEMEGWKS